MARITVHRSGAAEVVFSGGGLDEASRLKKRLVAFGDCSLDEEISGSGYARWLCPQAFRREGFAVTGRLDASALAAASVIVELPKPARYTTAGPGWTTSSVFALKLVYAGDGPPPPVEFQSGYAGGEWLLPMAPFAICLIFAPLAAALMRRRALALAAQRRGAELFSITTWFGWMLTLAVFTCFFTGFFQADLAAAVTGEHRVWHPVLHGALVTLPALTTLSVCVALFAPVYRYWNAPDISAADIFRFSVLRYALFLVPAGILAAAMASLDFTYVVAYLLAAALAGLAIYSTLAAGVRVVTVAGGEFHDRMDSLASQARVKLRGIRIVERMPAGRANAFAMRGGYVLFTRHLLEQMTRREVDAVMAHELGHLKGSHHALLGVGLFVVMAAAFLVFGSIPPGFYLATPLLGAAFVALRTWISRRLEYRADRAAAKILGDPEAVISSLAKLARLNNLPLNWGAIEGKLLTHPSLIERAESIAGATGFPVERARAIVSNPNIGDDSGRYPLPEVLTCHEGVLSDAVRGWVALAIVWSRRLALVAVPMALARLVLPETTWIESWTLFGRIAFRALLWLPLFLAVWLAVDSVLLRAPYILLRRRFGQAGDTAFVGYAPGSTARVFGSYDYWDLGFLKITADRLVVAGDRQSFALRREWVQKAWVGRGLPGLFPQRRVFLSWSGEDGAERVLNLRCCEGWSALGDNAWSKRLAAEIGRWRAGTGAHPACSPEQAALEAPRLDEVYGMPIQRVVRWPAVFTELTMVWLMAAAINFIALDSFVLLADFYPPLFLLLQRLPALLAKE